MMRRQEAGARAKLTMHGLVNRITRYATTRSCANWKRAGYGQPPDIMRPGYNSAGRLPR
jgi:hypothetical protein